MNRTFTETKLEAMLSGLDTADTPLVYARRPVNRICCSAERFDGGATRRAGEAALQAFDSHAPDFVTFARAMWLNGADTLPRYDDLTQELEFELIENAENVKAKNYAAWYAWTIYQRTIEKLRNAPVEELQIVLTGDLHSAHASTASTELAKAFLDGALPPFVSLSIPTIEPSALNALDLFLVNLIEKTAGKLPEEFSVTVAKAARPEEIAALEVFLSGFENRHAFTPGSIKIGLTISSPGAIVDDGGQIVLTKLAGAGRGRCVSAHLDADSFLSELDVPAAHRYPRHEACNFARQIMHLVLSPMNIGLSDSIVPPRELSPGADTHLIHRAWREHFNSVTHSMIGGFYQGLDPDPRLLPARYAAIYSFFMEATGEQGKRFQQFAHEAAAGRGSGDEGHAQRLLNFFYRALDCGALTQLEVSEATGLTREELALDSFSEIVRRRQYKAAAS